MLSPLTNTLIRIFSRGFFRANSGMLIFFIVTIGSSFFFMETVGDVNLLSPEELTFYHFILVITFISSPLMTLVIFFVWLLYTIKSWRYVTGQFLIPNHRFLFYSITSLNKVKQFMSWLFVQLVIFLPLIGYWLFACVVGIVFHQYLLPVVILLYLLILAALSALLYTFFINRLTDGTHQSYLLQISHSWRKPYFSLFIYYLLDKMKLVYVLTKIVSLLTIIGLLNSFGDANNDLRVEAIIILSVITVHSYLIYQEHYFAETQMSFSRNLPYSRARLFLNFNMIYLLILLPEIIWLLVNFNPANAVGLLVFGLSIALLFQSLLYWLGLGMFNYIRWVFGLYIALFLVIIFGLWWILAPFILLLSYVIFYRNYYNQKEELKS